jgi:FixJ family two-component response regulator
VCARLAHDYGFAKAAAGLGVDPSDHIVFVVDDDTRICEALSQLLASFDLRAVSFHSAAEYIAFPKPDVPACLILDVELPDMSGLDLQRDTDGRAPPVIFITGYGDVPRSVRAMKQGAVDFLTKPFDAADLMPAVHAALSKDREARTRRTELERLRERLVTLTPREREVLPLVVSGLLNKQAAAELGISEITVQIHRGKIMQKMQADSLAGLVRMAGMLEIPVTYSRHAKR